MAEICKNCGAEVQDNYCGHCSQSIDTARFTGKSFLDDLTYGLTNSNRGIFFTLKELFYRPGVLIANYISGKRVTYFRPMPMLIILASLYGLLYSLIDFGSEPPTSVIQIAGKTASPIIDLLTTWKDSTTFLTIIMLPIYALATRIVFRKTGPIKYNFAEYLFMGAYMACQRLAVAIVLLPYEYFDEKNDGALLIPYHLFLGLLTLALSVWDFKQVFGIKIKTTIRKTTLMFILAWFMALILACFAVLAIILFKIVADPALLSELKSGMAS